MAKVCDAVEHAHQRGVIHRDLKPGNILVDETGQPKILDFGVARIIGSDAQLTRQTDLGQLVGTLAYMSPEQVAGDPLALDLRTDIYALGVILYELLASKLPYNISRKPLPEAAVVIREEEPAPLSSMHRSYRGDIDTIVAKALEKDKARRYASAADLADDIRRYLADEPITARPASAGYRLQKFGRRHKALVAGTAAVFLVLAAGVVVTTWEAMRARQERNTALAEKRRADTEAATAQAISDFLQNDLLAQAGASNQASPSAKPDPDLKVRTALERAAARIAGKFDRQPEVEAAIRDTIGQTYIELGLRHEARTQLERALEIERRALGLENPKTLKTLSRLGYNAFLEGKYVDAEAFESQVFAISRRLLGAEHPDTLKSMYYLGKIYREQGRYAQAEALDKQSLDIQRRVLGPEHPDTLQSMNNLAGTYFYQSKFADAEQVFIQALEIQRRKLGAEHPDTVGSMQNLAVVYHHEFKYALAEALSLQTLEIMRRVSGPEHPNTLSCMLNLGSLYLDEGKYAASETLEANAWETQRRVLGGEHPNTLRSANNLARTYAAQGRYIQAETLLRRSLETLRRVLGPEAPLTTTTMIYLGEVYNGHGEYAQAAALFRQAIEIRRRTAGPENPATLSAIWGLASVYQREGKYILAQTHLAQVLPGWRHNFGSESPDTINAAADLALAYQSQGKFTESQPLAHEAVEFYQKKQPDDWQGFRAKTLLGASLAGQKKYAEAEPLLLQGYRGMVARKDRIAVPDRYHLDRAHEWVVQLYEAWGEPEKAAEWRKE